MGYTIAVVNQKGGVGKTTTAVNVSAALSALGKRVLLVDSDPQANATTGLGLICDDTMPGIYQLLSQQNTLEETIHATALPGLSIIPSSQDLVGAEIELALSESRLELREALSPSLHNFDYVIIDTPPSLGVLTLTCLVAADYLLIPVQCEYYALEGLRQLLHTVDLVRQTLNPRIRFLGLVRTMHDGRTNLSQQVAAELEKFFPRETFATVIPRSVRLSEAPSYGEPIITYDPRSPGAEAYRSLANEIVQRLESVARVQFVAGPDDANPSRHGEVVLGGFADERMEGKSEGTEKVSSADRQGLQGNRNTLTCSPGRVNTEQENYESRGE